jgi:acetate kinase
VIWRAIAEIHDWFAPHVDNELGFSGVGHRIVHGGQAYHESVLINETVMSELKRLVPLAPLHQPHNIAAVAAVASAPDVLQVACFDTAFHLHQPPLARQFALPREHTAKGVRRYRGFT